MPFFTKLWRMLFCSAGLYGRQWRGNARQAGDEPPRYSITLKFLYITGLFRAIFASSFDTKPFSNANTLTCPEIEGRVQALGRAGIRLFPYPFSTICAIVSDIDTADRHDYYGYKGLLVDDYGLDFGDSFRLHQRSQDIENYEALALYRYDGAVYPMSEQFRNYSISLGFIEILREYHRGNLDHFHSFNSLGQRFVWLPNPRRQAGNRWAVYLSGELESQKQGTFNFVSNIMPVLAIAVVPRQGELPAGTTLTVHLKNVAHEGVSYERMPSGDGNRSPSFSSSRKGVAVFAFGSEGKDAVPPLLKDVDCVTVALPDGASTEGIESLYLLNTHRPHLLQMLSHLYENFNVETNTITDHGSKTFLNATAEKVHAAQNTKRAYERPLPALYASARGGALYYSGLGDDPESISYVLPELRETFGIRFINPGGSSGEAGKAMHLMNAVVPSKTRDGSMIYVARRMVPVLPKSHPLARDMGTRSFPLRLERLLEDQTNHPDSAWPVYTHLGNVRPKSDRANPYFPKDTLQKLQDRVFNISGKINARERIHFTRASILYDYALMMRSIAPHVRREGDNTIFIESWFDPVLKKRLPVSPNQLHGVTLYVKRGSDARVFLDGKEFATLVRNRPDETGRESITLVGPGPCRTVLDDYDFIGHAGVDAVPGIEYRWRQHAGDAFRGHSYARMSLKSGGTHSIPYCPKGMEPYGMQYLAYAVRVSSEKIRVGVLIETLSGGAFYFGDVIALERECTATYHFGNARPGAWQFRIVPFYNLVWNTDAVPGGPLPSHPTKAIHFVVSGEAGECVDIDRVEFFRPATATQPRPEKGYVMGGRVCGHRPGMKVVVSYQKNGDGVARSAVLDDPEGFFVFTGIPGGTIVELFATDGDKVLVPTRGRYFDVWGNDMEIVI